MSAAIAENPRAIIGDNRPPSMTEILAEKHARILAEVEELAGRANAAPKKIANEGDLGAIGDIVRSSRLLTKNLDTTRKEEKEPHLTAGREIDGFFGAQAERLDRVTRSLQSRADDYQRERAAEERRRREEEARKAREEEARQREIARRAEEEGRIAAAAKANDRAERSEVKAIQADARAQDSAADLTRLRTETGTVVTTKTSWDFEITDLAGVSLDTLRPYLPRADIEKAIRTFVRVGGRELAGVRIFEKQQAAFR